MAKPSTERKRHFRAALALNGLTMREWAIAHGYDPAHVYNYINTKRTSRVLDAVVDAYIAEHAATPNASVAA